jgi:hypothetical protein
MSIQNEYMQAKQASGHQGHGFLKAGNVESARIGEELLGKAVEAGTKKAGPVISRVLSTMPDDALPRANKLIFNVERCGDDAEVGRLVMGWNHEREADSRTYQDEAFACALRPVHKNALGQLVSLIPGLRLDYVRELIASGIPWQEQLALKILGEHFGHNAASYLVRTVGGEHRGVLSSSYRRLDSRPLLDAFVGACNMVGAVPYDGVASDVRVAVRAIVPRVFNVNGDVFCLGLAWQNSDFGAGAYGISGFILRLLCDNGAMTENVLRQIHLGRKLDDAEIFSRETYELDTKTMVSATGDIVKALMAPGSLDKRVEVIKAAAEREVEFAQAVRPVRDQLTKGEFEKAKEAFEGRDEWNLPAGKSQWRASNALSWIAQDAGDQDRTLELQQMAGKLIPKVKEAA